MNELHLNKEELQKMNELQKCMSKTANENELKKVITEITLIREKAFVRQFKKE